MTNLEDRIPRRQRMWTPFVGDRSITGGTEHSFSALAEQAKLDPSSIKQILELGPGQGVETLALQAVFSQADITAVDYHNSILSQVQSQLTDRVNFLQGFFTDVLEGSAEAFKGKFDLLILSFTSSKHGFTGDNLDPLLVQSLKVGGYVFLVGDCGDLDKLLFDNKNLEVVINDYDRVSLVMQRTK